MSLMIKEIKDKEVWEGFLRNCREKTFLQSWNWGEFQAMMGNNSWRLGIYDEKDLIAVALVIKVVARRGMFLFVPHGPVENSLLVRSSEGKTSALKNLLEELKILAEKEKADFIRIAPVWSKNEENERIFKRIGLRDAPIHLHPELSWELDIRPKEELLLARMRKTTRYLIRQAERNPEIEIKQTAEVEDLEAFNKLYRETVDRHHFTPFSKDYLKNELLAFGPDNQIALFLGKYKGEVISSALVIFWASTGFYHQGASSLKFAKIPVSYLLQWEAIREAKKRGCSFYNFWGISPATDKKHPWFGLSQFKMGFGGYQKQYLKTRDLPLSKKYWPIFLFEKLRKIKRGL